MTRTPMVQETHAAATAATVVITEVMVDAAVTLPLTTVILGVRPTAATAGTVDLAKVRLARADLRAVRVPGL